CEATGSITRLLAAIGMVATGITTALFGLVGGLLGSLSTLAVLRGFAGTPTNNARRLERKAWQEILGYIMPILPTMVVYMVQDPLVLWLTLTFGGQMPLSETFAVGRIAAIYGLLGTFIIVVVEP